MATLKRKKSTLPEQASRENGTKSPRPRDAATLIIYRLKGKQVEVLMGQRHRSHKFLPQRYVFPGGRVDPTDSRVRAGTPIAGDVAELLARTATPARARALMAAAIRETFEEAGLTIGVPDTEPGKPVPANWKPFFDKGLAPSFEHINYVARAVTPHWRTIRFNARFFMIDHRHVSGDLAGSGELLDLTYVPLSETADLELSLVTLRVLELVEELARHPPTAGKKRQVINFHHNGVLHDMLPE
jgi:8-oxo-dGTP pyrophosphatase MutT (NUDIX family)